MAAPSGGSVGWFFLRCGVAVRSFGALDCWRRHSTEFGHLSLSQIVPRLADRGQYIASEWTFYRALKAERQLQHRGAERPRQQRSKPRALCATAPNQLFTWDITYLPTRIAGIYFYLYLFLDIFSRKIVGWQIYETESGALAGEVIRDICERDLKSRNWCVRCMPRR